MSRHIPHKLFAVESLISTQIHLFLNKMPREWLGINFINILWAAVTRADPKSAKWQSSCQSFFALSGSVHRKAACIMLMKLTPGGVSEKWQKVWNNVWMTTNYVYYHQQEIERVKQSADIPDWFSAIDINKNGVIDLSEIDNDFED